MTPEQIEEGRRRASNFNPLIKARRAYMTDARPKAKVDAERQWGLLGSGSK
jgi:hypothetical protein